MKTKSNKAQQKEQRLRAAFSHREGDRVPAGDFFWTGFLNRCRGKWGKDWDAYCFFDLDYVVIGPNLDPRIQSFEIVKQDGDDVVLKTGFGATIRHSSTAPMPAFEAFSIQSPEEMADFVLDDPADPRRFFEGGDDQLNCVTDVVLRNIPSWQDRMASYVDDFPVFGCVCEPYEYLWRIVGTENALLWMALERDQLAAFVDRLGRFLLDAAEAQIKAAQGRLSGMFIAGDVAYRAGMLFSKQYWRELFRPHVKALIDLCHRHNLMTLYHGCGNAREIFDDLVEIGLDAYHPLEAKAGLDVVKLKAKYAGKLAFAGNIDVRVLEGGDPQAITQEVLYKLQAARGGGWVFQSDHSVSSAVSPESYQLAIDTLRRRGGFPLAIAGAI